MVTRDDWHKSKLAKNDFVFACKKGMEKYVNIEKRLNQKVQFGSS